MTTHISDAEWDRIAKGFQVGQVAPARKGRGRSKYNARSVIVTSSGMVHAEPLAGDGKIKGIRFDSRREGLHYVDLMGLLQRGRIVNLVLQPVYEIHAADGCTKVASYRADFRYTDVETGRVVIVDVKGVRTPIYRLKKKLVEAEHGITIIEVK